MIQLPQGGWGSQKAIVLAGILWSCALHLGVAQKRVSVTLEPPNPQEGQEVTLTVRGGPWQFVLCEWSRAARKGDLQTILEYLPGPPSQQRNGTARSGRERVRDDCSLHIANLRPSDSGNYTVVFEAVRQETGHQQGQQPDEFYQGSVYLQVSDSSQITITVLAVPQHPNQGGDVTLTPQGTPREILTCEWFKQGSSGNPQTILLYSPKEQRPPQSGDVGRHERVTGGQDCSLRITKLTTADSGTYTVKIEAVLDRQQQQPGQGSRPQEPNEIQEYQGQVKVEVNHASSKDQQKGKAPGLGSSAGIVVGALLGFFALTDTLPFLFHVFCSSSSRPGRLP